METSKLVLELPPAPSYLGIARLFIGSVARHAGIEEERVDDLKVATSEACTAVIRARADGGGAAPVQILVRLDREGLRVEVPDAAGAPSPGSVGSTTDELTRELGLEVIRALFPTAETTASNGSGSISFTVELS